MKDLTVSAARESLVARAFAGLRLDCIEEFGMRLLLVAGAVMVSTAALGSESDTCKLVGEEKGKKIWQCAPTPATSTPVGGQQTNTVPADSKK